MRNFVFIAVAVVAVALSHPAIGQDLEALERQCAEGQAATDYPDWQFIANNAVRTADEYATGRNPRAVFLNGKVTPHFQYGGDHAGEYLVQVIAVAPAGVSFAVLKPNFPFCADPSTLDDERPDLFTVISAKLEGVPF